MDDFQYVQAQMANVSKGYQQMIPNARVFDRLHAAYTSLGDTNSPASSIQDPLANDNDFSILLRLVVEAILSTDVALDAFHPDKDANAAQNDALSVHDPRIETHKDNGMAPFDNGEGSSMGISKVGNKGKAVAKNRSPTSAWAFIKKRTQFEVQLVATQLLKQVASTQQGRFSVPPYTCHKAHMRVEVYPDFQTRMDMILKVLRQSKLVCKNLFDAEVTWTRRLAMQPEAELSTKTRNAKSNKEKGENLKIGRSQKAKQTPSSTQGSGLGKGKKPSTANLGGSLGPNKVNFTEANSSHNSPIAPSTINTYPETNYHINEPHNQPTGGLSSANDQMSLPNMQNPYSSSTGVFTPYTGDLSSVNNQTDVGNTIAQDQLVKSSSANTQTGQDTQSLDQVRAWIDSQQAASNYSNMDNEEADKLDEDWFNGLLPASQIGTKNTNEPCNTFTGDTIADFGGPSSAYNHLDNRDMNQLDPSLTTSSSEKNTGVGNDSGEIKSLNDAWLSGSPSATYHTAITITNKPLIAYTGDPTANSSVSMEPTSEAHIASASATAIQQHTGIGPMDNKRGREDETDAQWDDEDDQAQKKCRLNENTAGYGQSFC